MIQISVIIPVYNSEKYLRDCLDSVLNQTYSDFELLLINDGSTDASGEICDEYAVNDNRICVFHKNNGGVSSARNVGIQNAKGKYSIHVDADDYIDRNMFSDLFERIENSDADIVICDYYVKSSSELRVIKQGGFYSNSDCIKQILSGKMHGSTCNKLIRHELYKNYAIEFPENLSIGEDMFVVISLLLKTNKIQYLPKAYYYYMYNETSITNLKSIGLYKCKIQLAEKIDILLANHKEYIKSIYDLKISIRRDLLIFNHPVFKIRHIFPETNNYILASSILPYWLKAALLAEIYNFTILKNIIFGLKSKITLNR